MAFVCERKENQQALLTIDIPVDDFRKALEAAYRKNARKFNIPGFRPGKAPMGIVTKFFGEGVLYEDAIDACIPDAYAAAVSEHSLDVVSRPEIDILEVGSAKGLRFTALVTLKPEVTLGTVLGVEAPKTEPSVTDEDLEREVQRVRERNARMVPVEDGEIQDGDTARIDYEGFLDGVPFEGGKGEGHDLRIGSNSFIPGFETQLLGHKAGETFDIQVTFPEEYHSEELKGRDAVFHVVVHTVTRRELPVLDDEFARDVSEHDSLDAYRAELRETLEKTARDRAVHAFEDAVVAAVTDAATVEIPSVMVEHETDHMVEDFEMRMRYQGLDMETYLKYIGQTMDEFRAGYADAARRRVKTSLVLESCAKELAVEASEEDVEEELVRSAGQYGMTRDQLVERLGGDTARVRDSVVTRKTIARLTEAAVPVPAGT